MTQPAHGWRSHYALLMLLFVYTMSFIDRQIMGILVQPIKQKFGVAGGTLSISMIAYPFLPQQRGRQIGILLAFAWTLRPYAAERSIPSPAPRPAGPLATARA